MKSKKWLTLLLSGVMALSVGALAACGKDDDDKPGDSQDTTNPGDTNKPDDKPNPTPDGDYTVDETVYYIAGKGGGSLKSIPDWSATARDLALARDTSADHNVFNITLDLYAGDAFQILHDDSWDGQMGIDYFLDTEEDDNYSHLVSKNADGDVVFFGDGMHGTDITVEKGQDGVYTISLHTFPDGDADSYITWTKDGELSALLDMYVVSDMNDFGFNNKYAASHMQKTGDNWKYVLEVKEDDLVRGADGEKTDEDAMYVAVAVRNDVADETGYKEVTCDENLPTTWVGNDEYNLLPAGTYTLLFNPETKTLTITDGGYELYFAVDGVEADKLTEDNDGNWYGYITLEEAAQVNLYNSLAQKSYTGANLDAGEYFFKFTTAEEKVEYEKCGYYIAGTLEGAEWGVGATSPKMTYDEATGNYTYEMEASVNASFKVVYGSKLGGVKDWISNAPESALYTFDDMGNLVISKDGDYTVTYNPKTAQITVTEKVIKVTVSFDLNYPADVEEPEGQTAPASQTINKGALAQEPTEEFTLEGYTFIGWYLDPDHKDVFDFGAPVKGDVTLYAYWLADSEDAEAPKIKFNLNYTGAAEAEAVETVDGLIPEGSMPADPERDGYYFLGWYTTTAGTTEFNFENPVKIDTTVYAKWLKIDTRPWHIVGIANWNSDDHTYMFTHDDKLYPKQNVFSITLTMNKGSEFKILGVDTWSAPEVNGTHLDKNGTGELTGSNGSNISVGETGIYTLILSTDPNSDNNMKLTYTYSAFVSDNDMYFQINGVKGDKLSLGGDGNWTGTVYVRNGATVKLLDAAISKTYELDAITGNGDYAVTFNPEGESIIVEEIEYYVAGSFTTPSWAVGATSPKFVWNEEAGAYTVEITTTAEAAEFKVVIGDASTGFVNWNNDFNNAVTESTNIGRNGDNLTIKTAGTYILTLDVSTGTITATPKAA